ncbi:MAG: lysophospholipid acyltransferase family protein [Deltaproteobacteria bacterium]|nr:lysophospholipid acyltransferase family protein [Deltaproteobacteria bacterium]
MACFLELASWLVRRLSLRAALGLGRALGWIWYHLIPVRRKVALDNLRRAFPDMQPAERRAVARRCFCHWACAAMELLRLPDLDARRVEALIEHRGLEHLERARKRGRGVIVATAHFGSFDLMACAEAIAGHPLHVLTREQRSKSVNRFWMRVREASGLGFLPVKGSALRVHRLLGQERIVAMMIDQHMPEGRGIWVPFFGQPASTTHAPAVMALGSGAPILPVRVERLSGGRHRVQIEPMIEARKGEPRQAEVERITRALNAWLEGCVRERPDHWLWIHRRWKAPPGV